MVNFFRKKSASVVQSSNKSVGPVFEVKGVFLVWVILFRLSDHLMRGHLFSNLSFFALGAEEFLYILKSAKIHFSRFTFKYSLSDIVKESSDSICNENIYILYSKNKSLY